MSESKCSVCGGDLPTPQFDGDTPPEVSGKPVCYQCWSIEYTNKSPIIINYRMTSYVQGKENIMESKVVRLDQLSEFLEELFRRPGYWVDFILLEKGCEQ